jgi:hypothetical protein
MTAPKARSRHTQAHRPQLWLGANNRGLVSAGGSAPRVAVRALQGCERYSRQQGVLLEEQLACVLSGRDP